MIAFAVLAILALTGFALRQTIFRWLAAEPDETRKGLSKVALVRRYLRWLGGRVKTVFAPGALAKGEALLRDWTAPRYPGPQVWIFYALAAAFLYLALSGLVFAVAVRPFFHRGMYGLPLLAHVAMGGVFAVALAALVPLRARDNRPVKEEAAVFEAFACPILKNVSKALVRKALFWTFAALGFIQIATALGSMLPIFFYETQLTLIMVHRYSALGLVLTAILALDLALPDKKPPRA